MSFFHHFFQYYYYLFFLKNVGSVVDSFLPMHAPKIIWNFDDGVHVHLKFFHENVPFLKGFCFWFHSYYCFLFVIFFWQFVANDRDVVNVDDLVVLGRHGGVDVFA
jgi:hypothetical protein